MKNELYKWQKNIIEATVVLTSIAILYNDHLHNGDRAVGHFRWDLLLDFSVGIGANILILWLVFKFINWVYHKSKK